MLRSPFPGPFVHRRGDPLWSPSRVQEVTNTLMKSIPQLSSQPLEAVNAVSAIGAPTHGCYIQYNDHEQDDDKCHHALLFSFTQEGCSSYTLVKDVSIYIGP